VGGHGPPPDPFAAFSRIKGMDPPLLRLRTSVRDMATVLIQTVPTPPNTSRYIASPVAMDDDD
jgi:hypothetical protein